MAAYPIDTDRRTPESNNYVPFAESAGFLTFHEGASSGTSPLDIGMDRV